MSTIPATESAQPRVHDGRTAGSSEPRSHLSAIHALVAAMTAAGIHDPAHSDEVAGLACRVADQLQVGDHTAREVRELAMLHDLGKLGVPHAVLDKREPLDADERRLLCEHPRIGAHIVAGLPELTELAPGLEAAHERWDGTGYPAGLHGEEIPLASRIVFVCEAYSAMTEERPYRPALDPPAALQVISYNAGEQFCPTAVRALNAVVGPTVQRQAPGATRAQRKLEQATQLEQVGRALAKQRHGRAKLDRRELFRGPKLPWWVWLAVALVGLAVGLLIALPLPDVSGQCPPPQEGRASCELNKVWLPAIQTVVLTTAGFVLFGLAITRLPLTYRRWRRGDYRRVKLVPARDQDPLLAAASWGLVMEDANAGRTRRGRRGKNGRHPEDDQVGEP